MAQEKIQEKMLMALPQTLPFDANHFEWQANSIKISVEILVISIVPFYFTVAMCFCSLLHRLILSFCFLTEWLRLSFSNSFSLSVCLSVKTWRHSLCKWNLATTFALVYAVFYFILVRRFVLRNFSSHWILFWFECNECIRLFHCYCYRYRYRHRTHCIIMK